MLIIPELILAKLTCKLCNGYLRQAPIMVNDTSTHQICGKCYKILPNTQSISGASYVRQIGLEAVMEMFQFPCRYHVQGCEYQFTWNNTEDTHELDCKHNSSTGSSERRSSLSDETAQKFEYEPLLLSNNSKRNSKNLDHRTSLLLQTPDLFKDAPNVPSTSMENLNKSRNSSNLSNRPQSSATTSDNIYETIPNCSNNCSNSCSTYNHCQNGHTICEGCQKTIGCRLCLGVMKRTKEVYAYCKNAVRGCTGVFHGDALKLHEIDCEFNEWLCPIYDCSFKGTLLLVCGHLQMGGHSKNVVIQGNFVQDTLSTQDREWCMLCYGKMFSIKYFFYGESIEFVCKYLGTNDDAADFKYEVVVDYEMLVKPGTKRAPCLGWNEILEEAINYELKYDLSKCKVRFDVRLLILH